MNFLRKLLYGRYGPDQLNSFLLAVYFILWLLTILTRFGVFSIIGLVILLLILFRMFSRNFSRRRAENARFLAIIRPISQWFKLRRTIRRDKEHSYFKCPNCGQRLRVPRGKGKITITCRSCGASFQEKS